jgi:hypothetical protein
MSVEPQKCRDLARGTHVVIQKRGQRTEIVPCRNRTDGEAVGDKWCQQWRWAGPPFPKYAVAWLEYPDEQDWING